MTLGKFEVLAEPSPFAADDGRVLEATLRRPQGEASGAVLIVPAMAMPAWWYASFATHLASRGLLVLTFDYRGLESVSSMRRERGDLTRWALDARDALAHLHDLAGGLPVTWLGHSLGGQLVAFARPEQLDRVVLAATGDGIWRLSPHRWKAGMPLFSKLIAPGVSTVMGYYPGSRLGLMGNAPKGVMRQWLRWADSMDYLGVDHPDAPQRYADLHVPVHAIEFADDGLMSRANLTSLLRRFTGTTVTRETWQPADLGLARVGHFGLFRSANHALWDRLVVPRLAGIPAL